MSKEYEAAKAVIVENEKKIARLQGKAEAVFDAMRADPEHIELMRAKAWLATGGVKSVRLSANDTPVDLPDGWPDGVTQEHFIDSWAAGQLEKFNSGAGPETQAPVNDAVAQFRELLK